MSVRHTPVDPDALLLEKYLQSPIDLTQRAASSSAPRDYRSASGASSSNSLYTTAPANIGGGFFQQVNNATTDAATKRRRIFDLESYNQLKESYFSRRVQEHRDVEDREVLSQRKKHHQRVGDAGQMSQEAERLVRMYTLRRDGDAARDELNIRLPSVLPSSITPKAVRASDHAHPSSFSPDWIRHRMVLQTASNMFGGAKATSGGGSDVSPIRATGATSPRSWQDEVIRNISTTMNTNSHVLPPPSINSSKAIDRAGAAVAHNRLPAAAECNINDDAKVYDDDFDDAVDCTDSTQLRFTPVEPLQTSSSVAPATNFANDHLNHSRAPTRNNSSERATHEGALVISTPATHSDPTTSMLAEIIKDREIAQGMDSLHARIDVVRSVMARKAIVQVEESTRTALEKKASTFFHHMFVFLDEGLSRSSLRERENLIRTQIYESSKAISRRECARAKLFEDWSNTESVERRRLVHQRDLFMSSLESPWTQLRRIWAPQYKFVVDEVAQRAAIVRLCHIQFVSMAMSCLERSEELHRRQLLVVRDPMLSLRGVFASRLDFASSLRPEGVDDDGFFLPAEAANEDGGGMTVDEDHDLKTLSPVDLLCLRGASEEDVACTHALFPHFPRVVEPQRNRVAATGPTVFLAQEHHVPDDSSTPMEWSSFFLQSSSAASVPNKSNTASAVQTRSKRQTPLLPQLTKHAASVCAVDIVVPAHLWLGWYGDHLLSYFQTQRAQQPQHWTAQKLRRLMQRFVMGSFAAPLTLVDYFSLWRPALKLLLKEGEERIRISEEALMPAHRIQSNRHAVVDLLHWHRQAVVQTQISDGMQSLLHDYLAAAQSECRRESIVRGGLYGFYAAWKGRLVFMRKVAEAEDESWETALKTAQRNALSSSPLQSEVSSSAAATGTTLSAPAPPNPFSDDGGSRSSSTNIQRGVRVPHSVGALPKRPLEALASTVSPFKERVSSTTPTPPPQRYTPSTTTAFSGSDSTISSELFSLADVTTTGWVKLANVTAALRLRNVCFDLPRIARCFQRAARVYEETTGLRNEGGAIGTDPSDISCNTVTPSPPRYGTSTMLNREGFELMVQILFNDMRVTKDLAEDLFDRWKYEQRYLSASANQR